VKDLADIAWPVSLGRQFQSLIAGFDFDTYYDVAEAE